MGFQPKLEPVRVADSVLISRLPDKCHEDTVMLTVTHLLSKIAGDYDIRYVVLSQKSRTAQVVFENYKSELAKVELWRQMLLLSL